MDEKIYIWAPSNSAIDLTEESREYGFNRLKTWGKKVEIENHIDRDYLNTKISQKTDNIKFLRKISNKKSATIIPVFGGYTSNILIDELKKLHFDSNILFCGKSDLTVLLNALYTIFNIKSVYGVDFAQLCSPNMSLEDEKIFYDAINRKKIVIKYPKYFNDGFWYISKRKNYLNINWKIENLNQNPIKGVAIGGNLESIITLTGTEFLPIFKDKIVMLESVCDISPSKFVRDLKHLNMASDLNMAKTIVFGKFAPLSPLNKHEIIYPLIKDYVGLINIPMVFNVDFSHTEPSYPFYIGGDIQINTEKKLLKHTGKDYLIFYWIFFL
ncbi:MAG: LD-carboxypeptidase [Methanobrevibacter sp.]|jgi:muramoyltetrapeptide carboxypeptidase LdcA involved in peptidoglycan recycling|nr:LD-carboxypeptidase [Candidatus Methanovirga procula]